MGYIPPALARWVARPRSRAVRSAKAGEARHIRREIVSIRMIDRGKEFTFRCDEEMGDFRFGQSYQVSSRRKAIKAARKDGWRIKGIITVCPKCSAKNNA